MPEILRDIICLFGVVYLLYRFYNMVVSTAKTLIDRNRSKSKQILHRLR
jgi:threonine/homoserine/homoserine lactone efflux protein